MQALRKVAVLLFQHSFEHKVNLENVEILALRFWRVLSRQLVTVLTTSCETDRMLMCCCVCALPVLKLNWWPRTSLPGKSFGGAFYWLQCGTCLWGVSQWPYTSIFYCDTSFDSGIIVSSETFFKCFRLQFYTALIHPQLFSLAQFYLPHVVIVQNKHFFHHLQFLSAFIFILFCPQFCKVQLKMYQHHSSPVPFWSFPLNYCWV